MVNMSEIKIKVAEALFPAFDAFHAIERQPLQFVYRVDVEGAVERILLCFSSICLIVFADMDDDSVAFWTESLASDKPQSGIDISASAEWRDLIGKTFGWGWITVNQQGYCDGVLLAFDGITPQVILNVVASSIEVRTINNGS